MTAAPLPTIGAARYAGQPRAARRGRPAADRRGHLRRRRRPARHAARLLRPQPAPAGAHRLASTPRRRSRCPACTRSSPPADLNGDVREAWYTDAGSRCPTRRGRRWPTARPGSPATRSRWSSRTAATSPRTPPSWSTSTTSRCPRSPTTRRAGRRRSRCVHEAYPGNVAGQLAGAPAETIADALRRRGARGQRDDLAAGVRRRADGDPRHRRGVVAGQRRADRLGGHPGAARGADVRRPAARPPRAPGPGDHPRRRRRLRAEGRAAARGHLRAARGARSWPRAVKWIEDRRENLHGRRAGAARARRRARSPSTPTATHPRRARSTTCRTSAPTRRRGRSAPARRPA